MIMIRINTNIVHCQISIYFKVSYPARFSELSPSSGTLQSLKIIIKYHKCQMLNFTKATNATQKSSFTCKIIHILNVFVIINIQGLFYVSAN
jgi:hypothetical protein